MINLTAKIREFVFNQTDSICDVFVYKATNVEEAHLGNLLILGETTLESNLETKKNQDIQYPYIINQVSSQAKKEYYQNRKRDAHKSMEESLKKANLFLAKTASEKKSFNSNSVGFAIAAYANQNFYFSASGKTKILLLRGAQLMELTQKLPIIEGVSGSKIFANMASGKLIKGDIILLVNSNFAETFPDAILRPVLMNNSFEKSFEYLSATMRNDKNNASGIIMLEIIEEKDTPVVRYSYEELKKISDKPQNNLSENLIKAVPTENEPHPEYSGRENAIQKNHDSAKKKSLFFSIPNSVYKNFLVKIPIYVKKITDMAHDKMPTIKNKRFENYLVKHPSKYFDTLKKNNKITLFADNWKRITITFIFVLLIIILIFYFSGKQSSHTIK